MVVRNLLEILRTSSVVPKLVYSKALISLLANPSNSRVKCLKKMNLEIEFITKN